MFPLGAIKSPVDRRDILLASVVPVATNLPVRYSILDEQSAMAYQIYGSCEGFTGKDILEYLKKKHGTPVELSGRGIYALCKANDGNPSSQGTYTRIMLDVLCGVGAPYEVDFPNVPMANHQEYISGLSDIAIEKANDNKLGGYALITNIDELKTAIMKFGACPITIPVYSDYLAMDSRGVIQQPPAGATFAGQHEISAIGWDDELGGVLIKNHWGTGWGTLGGYGFMPYTYAGARFFLESYSVVDFIDATVTSGAPVNLAYPLDNIHITQHFGENPDMYKKYGMNGHNGTDFRAATGTDAFSCDDGTVIYAALKGGYGNCIIIQHSWGTSLYGHLQLFLVGVGAVVTKKQLIAKTNGDPSTQPGAGNSTAAHLHFGMRITGVKNPGFFDYVDAEKYFAGKVERMLVFFQVKGQTTVWALMDGEWVGFSDPVAFNQYTDNRPSQILQLDQGEFNKLKASPDVFKK